MDHLYHLSSTARMFSYLTDKLVVQFIHIYRHVCFWAIIALSISFVILPSFAFFSTVTSHGVCELIWSKTTTELYLFENIRNFGLFILR